MDSLIAFVTVARGGGLVERLTWIYLFDFMALLTQQQVNDLPNYRLEELIWAGGNGPHIYKIRRDGSQLYTLCNSGPYAEIHERKP